MTNEIMAMTQYRISLHNSAGEIDVRVVNHEEEIRAAALDIISDTAFLCDGDHLSVSLIDTQAEG